MQFSPGPPPPQQHTTADLFVLLEADGAPFGDVAAAVRRRFGSDAESRAWLARTLLTLLRDGLLYTQVEKLNAAYLLRFGAADAPGTREALLHLSLPDSGEPPAVRAWAAALAVAPAWAATPQALQEQQQAGGVDAAALAAALALHQRSPRQVLAEAAAAPALDSPAQQFLGSLPLGEPPQAMPWQGDAQQQQQQQHWQALEVEASLAAPWSPSQQQQEQEEAAAMQALLLQAARAPLVPATQQRLIAALRGELAPTLTAPLAEAVDGSSGSSGGGGSSGSLQPQDMRGLVEHNSPVAAELLLALAGQRPEAAPLYAAAVAELPMSAQSVEVLSALAGAGAAPAWVLAAFLGNCMHDTNACQDAGRQSRQVRLLCACVALVMQRQPGALEEALPELLSFCIQHSRHKQASELYRALRDMEA